MSDSTLPPVTLPAPFGPTTPMDRILAVLIMGLATPLVSKYNLTHDQLAAVVGAILILLNVGYMILNESKTKQSPIAFILNLVSKSGQIMAYNKAISDYVAQIQPGLKSLAEADVRKAGGPVAGAIAAPIAGMIEVKAVGAVEAALTDKSAT